MSDTTPTPDVAELARWCRERADDPLAFAFAQARFTALADALDRLEAAEKAVAQGGDRVLRCAFCGQPYPEGTPTHKHEALAAHIRECKEHPVGAELRTAVARAEAAERRAEELERAAADVITRARASALVEGMQMFDALMRMQGVKDALGAEWPTPPAAKGGE